MVGVLGKELGEEMGTERLVDYFKDTRGETFFLKHVTSERFR